MGVVVAHGVVHLGQQLHIGDALARSRQAGDDVGQLLAHGGGAGRLPVGAAEHGGVGVGVGQLAQSGDDGIQPLQQHGAPGLQLQRVAGVVDVFASANEMHEFAGRLQLGAVFKAALDPVFDGLDVVIGGFFYGFDGLGVGFEKVLPQADQKFARAGRQGGKQIGRAHV